MRSHPAAAPVWLAQAHGGAAGAQGQPGSSQHGGSGSATAASGSEAPPLRHAAGHAAGHEFFESTFLPPPAMDARHAAPLLGALAGAQAAAPTAKGELQPSPSGRTVAKARRRHMLGKLAPQPSLLTALAPSLDSGGSRVYRPQGMPAPPKGLRACPWPLTVEVETHSSDISYREERAKPNTANYELHAVPALLAGQIDASAQQQQQEQQQSAANAERAAGPRERRRGALLDFSAGQLGSNALAERMRDKAVQLASGTAGASTPSVAPSQAAAAAGRRRRGGAVPALGWRGAPSNHGGALASGSAGGSPTALLRVGAASRRQVGEQAGAAAASGAAASPGHESPQRAWDTFAQASVDENNPSSRHQTMLLARWFEEASHRARYEDEQVAAEQRAEALMERPDDPPPAQLVAAGGEYLAALEIVSRELTKQVGVTCTERGELLRDVLSAYQAAVSELGGGSYVLERRKAAEAVAGEREREIARLRAELERSEELSRLQDEQIESLSAKADSLEAMCRQEGILLDGETAEMAADAEDLFKRLSRRISTIATDGIGKDKPRVGMLFNRRRSTINNARRRSSVMPPRPRSSNDSEHPSSSRPSSSRLSSSRRSSSETDGLGELPNASSPTSGRQRMMSRMHGYRASVARFDNLPQVAISNDKEIQLADELAMALQEAEEMQLTMRELEARAHDMATQLAAREASRIRSTVEMQSQTDLTVTPDADNASLVPDTPRSSMADDASKKPKKRRNKLDNGTSWLVERFGQSTGFKLHVAAAKRGASTKTISRIVGQILEDRVLRRLSELESEQGVTTRELPVALTAVAWDATDVSLLMPKIAHAFFSAKYGISWALADEKLSEFVGGVAMSHRASVRVRVFHSLCDMSERSSHKLAVIMGLLSHLKVVMVRTGTQATIFPDDGLVSAVHLLTALRQFRFAESKHAENKVGIISRVEALTQGSGYSARINIDKAVDLVLEALYGGDALEEKQETFLPFFQSPKSSSGNLPALATAEGKQDNASG